MGNLYKYPVLVLCALVPCLAYAHIGSIIIDCSTISRQQIAHLAATPAPCRPTAKPRINSASASKIGSTLYLLKRGGSREMIIPPKIISEYPGATLLPGSPIWSTASGFPLPSSHSDDGPPCNRTKSLDSSFPLRCSAAADRRAGPKSAP